MENFACTTEGIKMYQQYLPLFLKYRVRKNGVKDEIQNAFITFHKYCVNNNPVKNKYFVKGLKDYLRGTNKGRHTKVKKREDRLPLISPNVMDSVFYSIYKTPVSLSEEKEVDEIYFNFKKTLSQKEKLVLDCLEKNSIHETAVFCQRTGFSREYFRQIKEKVKKKIIEHYKTKGINILDTLDLD